MDVLGCHGNRCAWRNCPVSIRKRLVEQPRISGRSAERESDSLANAPTKIGQLFQLLVVKCSGTGRVWDTLAELITEVRVNFRVRQDIKGGLR